MTGTIEQQYIVAATHPFPPDGPTIRKYVWYERFDALNRELFEEGVVSGAGRARLLVGIEKLMIAAAAGSVFGRDKHRERAALFLAAELRSADPECPIPPQVKAPIKTRKGAANAKNPGANKSTQSVLPS